MTTITLRVDTLVLRPWHQGDIASLIEVYRDRTLRRWTSLPVENTEDAKRWLAAQQQGWATGERLSFAVHQDPTGTGDHRLAGYVALKRPDAHSGSAEVAYWTAAHARGRGVAPRALEALTTWAFTTFTPEALHHIDLIHQVDNTASCRVAEKTHYPLTQVLPPYPPAYPQNGHLHTRHQPSSAS